MSLYVEVYKGHQIDLISSNTTIVDGSKELSSYDTANAIRVAHEYIDNLEGTPATEATSMVNFFVGGETPLAPLEKFAITPAAIEKIAQDVAPLSNLAKSNITTQNSSGVTAPETGVSSKAPETGVSSKNEYIEALKEVVNTLKTPQKTPPNGSQSGLGNGQQQTGVDLLKRTIAIFGAVIVVVLLTAALIFRGRK